MKEFDFIRQLQSKFGGGVKGIGDDGVLVGEEYLIVKDILLEGVHFLKTTPIDLVIGKLFTCNISDIAAMGGKAESVLIGVACSHELLPQIAEAMEKYAKYYDVKVIGGDTSDSMGGLFLSMTAIGKRGKNILTRAAGKVGHKIYLSRSIGLAKIALEKELADTMGDMHHYSLRADVLAGKFLGEFDGIGACCDISDGLGRDLSNIANASQVKAVILITPEIIRHLEGRCSSAEDYFISSGEEFALIFSVDGSKCETMEKEFEEATGVKPIQIGVCEEGRGCCLRKDGVDINISTKGYEHFKK